MDKISLIDEYIQKAESMLQSNDFAEAKNILERFIRVFQDEIKNIADGLNAWYYSGRNGYEWKNDLLLMIDKLRNLKGHLYIETEKSKTPRVNINPQFTQSLINTNTNNITITYEIAVEHLDNSSLSEEDKDMLRGMLASIETQKKKNDRNKLWEKVKKIFTWVADKAVDASVAAWLLPYLTTLFV